MTIQEFKKLYAPRTICLELVDTHLETRYVPLAYFNNSDVKELLGKLPKLHFVCSDIKKKSVIYKSIDGTKFVNCLQGETIIEAYDNSRIKGVSLSYEDFYDNEI